MRARFYVVLLAFLLSLLASPVARAEETSPEHAADVYATQQMASHPLHGNLPDYALPADKLAKAQHLSTLGVRLYVLDTVWGIAQIALLLWLGVIGWMRDRAVALSANRWVQGFAFVGLYLLATFLLNLPLSLYGHHLGLQYGFSVQGWLSWFADKGKALGLTWLVGGLIVMLLFWIIRKLPRAWWLVFWVALLPLTAFGSFLYPYTQYLFYKHELLSATQPELVAKLETMVAKNHMDIPPERMYLERVSDKVTTLNADVEGLGASKRVVVWDNTVAKATPDEILFIFGHESGHYVLGHIVRGMAEGLVGSLLVLWLCYLIVNGSIARFGTRWKIPSQGDWGALAVVLLAVTVLNVFGEPIESTLSRQKEHAADVFGQEALHGLVADPQGVAVGAFDVLGTVSLDDPNPSPLYEFWAYGHPSIGRRASFARAYDPWASGVAPKYFPKP